MAEQKPSQTLTPEAFTGGNVLLDTDQLVDPSVTLQRVSELLSGTGPDALPQIQVASAERKDQPGVSYVFVNTDGEEVATACLSVSDELETENLWWPTVRPSFTNEGYGTAMYLFFIKQALERNHDFRTDPSGQTDSAVKAWKRLRGLGIAQVAQEFTLPEGAEKYQGYYVVNGNNKPKRSMLVAKGILRLTQEDI